MIYHFNNYGYYLIELEENSLLSVKEEIQKIKSNSDHSISLNNTVDAHISNTFRIKDSVKDLEKLIFPYFVEYENEFNYIGRNYSCLTEDLFVTMNDAWVSFQNKFEFNPAHTHPGLMSFVLWLDIPYSRDDEIKHSPGNSVKNRSGSFSMYYTDCLGNIETEDILLDHSFNNKMILFPSKIKHSVQPFYSSNLTRISVAGNFYFQSKGKSDVVF